MDMKNILQNIDAAAAGKKPSSASADVNDMKTILESIQSVEECGMGEMPQQMPAEPKDKMSMNVTLNAQGDAVEDLIKLMGGAVAPQEAPVRMPAEMPAAHDHDMNDMATLMRLAGDTDEETDENLIVQRTGLDKDGNPVDDDEDDEDVDEAAGEWDNSPDEDYKDHEYMTKDLAGGMHKEKKSHPPTNGGDNPMALEQSIKEQLWAALNEKFTTEGRGRGRGKKAKEDIETTEGRGKGKGRGRGKG